MIYFIGHLITSIAWGVLIAMLLTGLLFFVPRLLYSRYNHTAGSGILLLAGFFFFVFQGTLLAGSFKARQYIPFIGETIASYSSSPSAHEIAGTANYQEIQQICLRLSEQYPPLEKYINQIGRDLSEQDSAVAKPFDFVREFLIQLQKQINKYTGRRIGWITGGTILILLFLIHDANKQNKQFYIRQQRDLFTGQF